MGGEINIIQIPMTCFGRLPRCVKRVAAYCRVSTHSEEQTTSLEAQISYYRELILNHSGWELADIYSDRNTGRNIRKRKGLQQLLDDCRADKIDLILTKSISRLGRDTVLLLETAQELRRLDVDIFFETEKLSLHNPRALLMVTILGSLAQEESRDKSENIKWGIQYSFHDPNSKYLNRPCYGYRPGPNNTLQIESFEASIVSLIFQLHSEGISLRQIGKQMETLGAPSPKGSQRWGPETIRYILSNEKYKGDVRLQKTCVQDFFSGKQIKNNGELDQYYIENSHEAIIG